MSMAKKENKGRSLSNEDLENELRQKGRDREDAYSYVGIQDTGDRTVRPLGTEVQRRDGLAPEDLAQEEQAGTSEE
jgi:hypothetical protein